MRAGSVPPVVSHSLPGLPPVIRPPPGLTRRSDSPAVFHMEGAGRTWAETERATTGALSRVTTDALNLAGMGGSTAGLGGPPPATGAFGHLTAGPLGLASHVRVGVIDDMVGAGWDPTVGPDGEPDGSKTFAGAGFSSVEGTVPGKEVLDTCVDDLTDLLDQGWAQRRRRWNR